MIQRRYSIFLAVFLACLCLLGFRHNALEYPIVAILFALTISWLALEHVLPDKASYRLEIPKVGWYLIVFLVACLFAVFLPGGPGGSGEPISAWNRVGVSEMLRMVLLVPICLFIPGWVVLSLGGLDRFLGRLEKWVLSVLTSILLGSLLSAFSALFGVFWLISWVFPLVCVLLGFLLVLGTRSNSFSLDFNPGSLGIFLVMVFVLAGSLAVQVNTRYLVGGDLWRTTKIASHIRNNPDFVEDFMDYEVIGLYPSFSGYIILLVSLISGWALVNTYVSMFWLVALGVVVAYLVFSRIFGEEVNAVVATMFFAVGGGLGWVAFYLGVLPYNSDSVFVVSHQTQDIYFSTSIWNSILQTPMLLATFFSLVSLLVLWIGFEHKGGGWRLWFLGGCFTAVSYLIHVLEPMILVVPFLCLLSLKWSNLKAALFWLLGSGCSFLVVQLANSFYDLAVLVNRIDRFLVPTVEIALSNPLLTFLAVTVLLGVFLLIWYRNLVLSKLNPPFPEEGGDVIVIMICVGLWLLGLLAWYLALPMPPLIYDVLSIYPPYIFVVKYGIVLLLALIGFSSFRRLGNLREVFFPWAIYALTLSILFWGHRTSIAFLFAICPVAVIGMNGLVSALERRFAWSKVFSVVVVVAILFSSTMSYSYTTRFFADSGMSVEEGVVESTRWIFDQGNRSKVYFVPDGFDYDFVSNIALQRTVPTGEPFYDFEESNNATNQIISLGTSPLKVVELLIEWNICRALLSDGHSVFHHSNAYLQHIIEGSEVLFEAGNSRVLEFPSFRISDQAQSISMRHLNDRSDRFSSDMNIVGILNSYFTFWDIHLMEQDDYGIQWSGIDLSDPIDVDSELTYSDGFLSLRADPGDDENHWYRFSLDLSCYTEADYIRIVHRIDNLEAYLIQATFIDNQGNGHAWITLRPSKKPLNEVHVLPSDLLALSSRIELTLWTTARGEYNWKICDLELGRLVG